MFLHTGRFQTKTEEEIGFGFAEHKSPAISLPGGATIWNLPKAPGVGEGTDDYY